MVLSTNFLVGFLMVLLSHRFPTASGECSGSCTSNAECQRDISVNSLDNLCVRSWAACDSCVPIHECNPTSCKVLPCCYGTCDPDTKRCAHTLESNYTPAPAPTCANTGDECADLFCCDSEELCYRDIIGLFRCHAVTPDPVTAAPLLKCIKSGDPCDKIFISSSGDMVTCCNAGDECDDYGRFNPHYPTCHAASSDLTPAPSLDSAPPPAPGDRPATSAPEPTPAPSTAFSSAPSLSPSAAPTFAPTTAPTMAPAGLRQLME